MCLIVCGSVGVSVRKRISETYRTPNPNFALLSVYVHFGLVRWRCCNMSGTSGFVDDVILPHNRRRHCWAMRRSVLNFFLFRCHSLGRDTAMPGGLHARLCHGFLVFKVIPWRPIISGSYWTAFHHIGRSLVVDYKSVFLRSDKNETDWNIATPIVALTAAMIWLHREKFGELRSSNSGSF